MNDENNFRDLATSAMKVAGRLLETLEPEAQDALNGALHAGARLTLEFGPLPAFEEFALVLVETEGMRTPVASVRLNSRGTVQ